MSKGSGRRRITPSDGLQYDPETDMTNIEQRGGAHFQSGSKEVAIGLRTGAAPTTKGHYGAGRRWGGKGRKDDSRNWKSHTRGKQYEHNAQAREAQERHKPVPVNVANRLREASIASDVARGYPCKAWSGHGKFRFTSEGRTLLALATEKFLVKFGGEMYRGFAERQKRPYQFDWYGSSNYYSAPRVKATVHIPLTGFALFEQKVRHILDNIRYGLIDEFGRRTY